MNGMMCVQWRHTHVQEDLEGPVGSCDLVNQIYFFLFVKLVIQCAFFLALLMFLFCVIPLLGIPSPCLSFLLLSRNPEGARVAQKEILSEVWSGLFSVGSRRRAAQNKAHICGPQAQLKNVTLRADCWKFWVFCSSCGGWCSKDTSEIDAENDAMDSS